MESTGIGQRRWLAGDPGWWAFAGLALVAIVLLQALSSDLTFVSDDWRIIDERNLTLASLLAPYNEHLSAVPVAILVVLRDTIGLSSHWPYLLLIHVAHVVACAGVFVIARRRLGTAPAIALTALVLVLGTGYENLFWAFQVGAVISTAAGVWALVILDRGPDRGWLVAALIATALASSSFGLPFVAAAGALSLAARRRSALVGLGLVLAAYVAWYAAFHSTSPGLCAPSPSLDLPVSIFPFPLIELWYAVGALAGIGLVLEPAVGLAAAAATLWLAATWVRFRRGDPIAVSLSAIFGIAAMGLLVGIGRGCLGPQVAGSSRYVYAAAMLAAIGIAAVLPRAGAIRSRIPRAALTPLVAGTVAVALALNVRALVLGHQVFATDSVEVRSVVQVSDGGRAGCHTSIEPVDALTSSIRILPEPARLRVLVERYGSPLDPGAPPPSVTSPDTFAAVERAMCGPAPAG